ncbi:acylphosphatase [Crossiella equi]|uniref:Acylphosphatase n=1 Tax=Crossiella equi TaxID=130796 RepID=A0ABS5AKD7_9PSEU|nr:acylphosphatase [Crossiella equi]MBP2477037.1 acylphosphatase [Crossiella equi]
MLNEEQPVRLTAWVHGQVQGVGFRWWTRSRALELGLVGWARNTRDGRVEVVAEGTGERCSRLLSYLQSGDTPGRVTTVVEQWGTAKGGLTGFPER